MALATILGGATLCGAVLAVTLWQWKSSRRARNMRRIKKHSLRWLGETGRKIETLHFIGVGNVGTVVLAKLLPGWEEDIGLFWRTRLPMPEEVVVKVCVFRDHDLRRQDLPLLAADVDEMLLGENPPPICPFTALGETTVEGLGRVIIELMPLVKGKSLEDAFAEGYRPDLKTAVHEITRIINTFPAFESRRWYSRNLDDSNVMLQDDGSWLRIDFDNARRSVLSAERRMRRLSRLAETVLSNVSNLPDTAEVRDLRDRLRRTDTIGLETPGALKTTEELLEELNRLV